MTTTGLSTIQLNHPEVTISDLIAGSEQISQRLLNLAATVGLSSKASYFYTRVRAKTPESIREKVSRKRRDRNPHTRPSHEHYSFRQLTDAVGFRIVTLYDAELTGAIDYILTLIRAGQSLADPLFGSEFIWNLFHDALFIRRDDKDDDPYAECLRYTIERISLDCRGASVDAEPIVKACREETRSDDRYSSAHLIFRGLAHLGNLKLEIPVEFQLRTAAEDIWAEINHKLLYKTNTSFAWSLEHELASIESRKASQVLKLKINDLSPIIKDFYTKSIDATSKLNDENFWKTETDYHSSICISLFFAIGDSRVVPLVEFLGEYDQAIRSLRETFNDAQVLPERSTARERKEKEARSFIAKGIKLLDNIIEKIKSIAEKAKLSDTDKILDQQRVYLCELDKLRLHSILAIYFDFEFSVSRRLKKIEKDENRRQLFVVLYKEFCERLDDNIPLRPICVILFFKHMLSARFNKDIAQKNLADAYRLVRSDKTIPSWSIYFILLPRLSASFRLAEIRNVLENPTLSLSKNIVRMRNFKFDVQNRLAEALNFALRAYRAQKIGAERYRDVSQRRGDLLFGFAEEDYIRDIKIIFDISLMYIEYFEGLHKRLLPAETAELMDVVNFVLTPSEVMSKGVALKALHRDAMRIKVALGIEEPKVGG